MSIQKNIPDLLRELKQFSHNKIKNPNDIKLLLEISKSEEQKKQFDEIIFLAKYINGLGKILHSPPKLSNISPEKAEKSSIQQDSIAKVKKEYQSNLEKFINLLSEFIKDIEEDKKRSINEKYFKKTQESMINITNLIYDFSWLKKYSNEKK